MKIAIGLIALLLLSAQPFLFWLTWEYAGDTWTGRGIMTTQAIVLFLLLKGGKSE